MQQKERTWCSRPGLSLLALAPALYMHSVRRYYRVSSLLRGGCGEDERRRTCRLGVKPESREKRTMMGRAWKGVRRVNMMSVGGCFDALEGERYDGPSGQNTDEGPCELAGGARESREVAPCIEITSRRQQGAAYMRGSQ